MRRAPSPHPPRADVQAVGPLVGHAEPFNVAQLVVLQRIAAGEGLSAVLEAIVRLVEGMAEGRMLCSILLVDRARGRVRHGAAPSLPADYARAIDGAPIGPRAGSCGTAAWLGERVVVEDIARHPYWEAYRHLALPHGLAACWSSPIYDRGRAVVGTFAMYYREPRGPTPQEVRWVDAATHLAALALGHHEAEREREQALRALAERVKELTVLHGAARLLQADRPVTQAFLDELVRLLPPGWQHPEVCEARIVCPPLEARTAGWREAPWTLSAPFAGGGRSGTIEVVYREAPPGGAGGAPDAEGAFLVEERRLLESLGEMLGAHLEHEWAVAALREREAELRQAQRLRALGTVAGSIAHDFNNILTAITGQAQLALRALAAGHPARGHVLDVESAARRAGALVRGILTFSRQDAPRRERLRLGPVVEEAVRLLGGAAPPDVEVAFAGAIETRPVFADPDQVHQVVMNLGTNAIQALGERGGRVEVALADVEAEPAAGRGARVRLTVRDDGVGMDAATRARVFEPFFTTKPPGEGTGLGLAIVHGVIEGHGGEIAIDSAPGRGTSIAIDLPAVEVVAGDVEMAEVEAPGAAIAPRALEGEGEVAGEGGAAPSAPPSTRSAGRVLYVDDEAPIVELARSILEAEGYRFDGFHDASSALEALRREPHAFACVISDSTMPGGPTGIDLARAARALRPELPIVLTSGYFAPQDIEAATALDVAELALKPGMITDLPALVARVVAPR